MKSEDEIRDRIAEIEDMQDWEGDAYLDEGQQAELATLYWVLDEEDGW